MGSRSPALRIRELEHRLADAVAQLQRLQQIHDEIGRAVAHAALDVRVLRAELEAQRSGSAGNQSEGHDGRLHDRR